MSPRVNLPPVTALDEITVGQLRRLVHGGLDESLTIADALTALHESEQRGAAHELDVREYNAYVDRRAQRRAEALTTAAAAADKANRGQHDGSRMAARQTARLEADEEFEIREPSLRFAAWIDAGRPEIHRVSAIRRAVRTVRRQEIVH